MATDINLGLGGTSVNPFLGNENPYLQQIIDKTTGDLVKQYNTTAAPAFNAGAIRSGSFGNSGIDESQRLAQSQLQQNIGDNASKLRFNDYLQQQNMYGQQQQANFAQQQFGEGQRQFDQNFGRATFNDAFSQNQTNLQAALGLLGWQGGLNQTDITNTTAQQNAPLSYLQQISQIGSGIGGMGGTSTQTQGTTSNPLVSGLGAAQLANNWWNTSGGGSTPISASNQNAFDSFGASNGWWGTAG